MREENNGQKIWSCPHCGSGNIYFEGLPCMACGEETEDCDKIFDDGEEDVY